MNYYTLALKAGLGRGTWVRGSACGSSGPGPGAPFPPGLFCAPSGFSAVESCGLQEFLLACASCLSCTYANNTSCTPAVPCPARPHRRHIGFLARGQHGPRGSTEVVPSVTYTLQEASPRETYLGFGIGHALSWCCSVRGSVTWYHLVVPLC